MCLEKTYWPHFYYFQTLKSWGMVPIIFKRINHNSKILSNPYPRPFPLKNTTSSQTASILETILKTDASFELLLSTRPPYPVQTYSNFQENVKLTLGGCSFFSVTPSIKGVFLCSRDPSPQPPYLSPPSNTFLQAGNILPIRTLLVKCHSLLLLSLLSDTSPWISKSGKINLSPHFKKQTNKQAKNPEFPLCREIRKTISSKEGKIRWKQ